MSHKITQNQADIIEYPDAAQVQVERDLLRAYLEGAQDGCFVLGTDLTFHFVNSICADWLGCSAAELTGPARRPSFTEFLARADQVADLVSLLAELREGQGELVELAIDPPHTKPRWLEVSLSRINSRNGIQIVCIARDITERKRLYSALEHYANHDDLTGLANRRQFQQRLNELVDSAQTDDTQHALVYIDLDQFKVVNDVCGHLAGDELLRRLGLRLQKLIQDKDLFARLGGDEFGLLLHDLPIEQVMQVAEALCESIGSFHFEWKDRAFEITASIGVCAITRDTLDAEAVLSAADAACYVAKDKGRNRVQLYFGGKACLGKRAEMEWVGRIQLALDNDRFQLWQQTILDLNHPQERNIEILLRMLDEEGQVIAPGLFFPSAEHYGLMPAIDRWVVTHLLLDPRGERLRETMRQEKGVRCAINLSGASLNDDKFLKFLEETLKLSNVPPASICFEITETVAIANLERFSEVMRALKGLGCQFALDDFGSGMSSFGYLKKLPVDYLKIDGALVRHIAEDPANLTMVEAINRIGRVLGIKTIAEFVEDEPTLAILRDIGVDYAQGYGIHKPEPLKF